jgi:hypothetical protein
LGRRKNRGVPFPQGVALGWENGSAFGRKSYHNAKNPEVIFLVGPNFFILLFLEKDTVRENCFFLENGHSLR